MLSGNIIVLRSSSGDYPFSAFFVKDDKDLEERLEKGDLKEGDLLFTVSECGEIRKHMPLVAYWEGV